MSDLNSFLVNGEKRINLKDCPTKPQDGIDKQKTIEKTQRNLQRMGEFQDKLYSEGKEGLVIIFQAMDAAGKDSTIKHVMKGLNPQGIDVYSFKQPSVEEDAHGFCGVVQTSFPQGVKWRFSTDPIMRKFLLCVCINYMKRENPRQMQKGQCV